ncbi:MAG: hypothetical protein ACYTKD_23185 [Planctomycetota bacterium]|jgi:hypothetical protein
MDGKTEVGGDRFDEVVADMNNSYMAVYGLARLLARDHAPEMATRFDAEVERYRGLVSELRKIRRESQ